MAHFKEVNVEPAVEYDMQVTVGATPVDCNHVELEQVGVEHHVTADGAQVEVLAVLACLSPDCGYSLTVEWDEDAHNEFGKVTS